MIVRQFLLLLVRCFVGGLLLAGMWLFHSRLCLYVIVTLLAIAVEIQGISFLFFVDAQKSSAARAANALRLTEVVKAPARSEEAGR